MTLCDHGEACARSARPCLQFKLRYWRSAPSSLGVHVPEGWRGPSVAEQERRQISDAAAAGVPIDRPPR